LQLISEVKKNPKNRAKDLNKVRLKLFTAFDDLKDLPEDEHSLLLPEIEIAIDAIKLCPAHPYGAIRALLNLMKPENVNQLRNPCLNDKERMREDQKQKAKEKLESQMKVVLLLLVPPCTTLQHVVCSKVIYLFVTLYSFFV